MVISRGLINSIAYDNPNDTYAPNNYVRLAHEMSGETFAFEQGYFRSVVILPVSLGASGLLSLFLLLIWLYIRDWYDSWSCLPSNDERLDFNERVLRLKRRKRNISFILYALCVLVFSFGQVGFVGYQLISNAASAMKKTSWLIFSAFDELIALGNELSTAGSVMLNDYTVAAASCKSFSPSFIPGDIRSFIWSSRNLVSSVHVVPSKMQLLQSYINAFLVLYKDIAFFGLWLLTVIAVTLFVFSQFYQKLAIIKVAMAWAMFTYFVFLAIDVLWMASALSLGDFCMEPSYNIIRSIDAGNLQNLANYYCSCTGNNPAGLYFSSATSSFLAISTGLSNMTSSLSQSGDACAASAMTTMQAHLSDIKEKLDAVDNALQCPPIQSLWFQVVNQGVCGKLIEGTILVWFFQLFTSFFLFLLVITASVSFQYFELYSVEGGSKKQRKSVYTSTSAKGKGVTDLEAGVFHYGDFADLSEHKGDRSHMTQDLFFKDAPPTADSLLSPGHIVVGARRKSHHNSRQVAVDFELNDSKGVAGNYSSRKHISLGLNSPRQAARGDDSNATNRDVTQEQLQHRASKRKLSNTPNSPAYAPFEDDESIGNRKHSGPSTSLDHQLEGTLPSRMRRRRSGYNVHDPTQQLDEDMARVRRHRSSHQVHIAKNTSERTTDAGAASFRRKSSGNNVYGNTRMPLHIRTLPSSDGDDGIGREKVGREGGRGSRSQAHAQNFDDDDDDDVRILHQSGVTSTRRRSSGGNIIKITSMQDDVPWQAHRAIDGVRGAVDYEVPSASVAGFGVGFRKKPQNIEDMGRTASRRDTRNTARSNSKGDDSADSSDNDVVYT